MSRDEILGLLIEQYEKDISLEFERGKRLEDKGHSLFGFDISTLAVLAGLFTVGQTLTTGTGLGTFSFVLIVYAIAVGFFVIATLLTMACFRVTTIKHAEGSTSLDDVNEELNKTVEVFRNDRLEDLVDSFASIKKENDGKAKWLRYAQIVNVIAVVFLACSVIFTIMILGGWITIAN